VANYNQDFFMPNTAFRQMGHLTTGEIDQISAKYPFANKTEEGIPVFGMVRALNEERKRLSSLTGAKINTEDEQVKIDYSIKYEQVMAKRISNQAKLGKLILKEEAEERIQSTFKAVTFMLKNAIKNIAPNLVPATDTRDIESIMTKGWNNAVDELKKGSTIIPWDNDGSATLLRTRLEAIEKAGSDFDDLEPYGV